MDASLSTSCMPLQQHHAYTMQVTVALRINMTSKVARARTYTTLPAYINHGTNQKSRTIADTKKSNGIHLLAIAHLSNPTRQSTLQINEHVIF
jgi:hypothetical protein